MTVKRICAFANDPMSPATLPGPAILESWVGRSWQYRPWRQDGSMLARSASLVVSCVHRTAERVMNGLAGSH